MDLFCSGYCRLKRRHLFENIFSFGAWQFIVKIKIRIGSGFDWVDVDTDPD